MDLSKKIVILTVASVTICVSLFCTKLIFFTTTKNVNANNAHNTNSFDKSYNLGVFPHGAVIQHKITIQNQSKQSVKLHLLEKACTCTEVKIINDEIAPKDEGHIEVIVDTADRRSGEMTGFTLKKEWPNGDSEISRYNISYRIDDNFGISSTPLIIEGVRKGKPPIEKDFKIALKRNYTINLSEIPSTEYDYVSISLSPSYIDGDKRIYLGKLVIAPSLESELGRIESNFDFKIEGNDEFLVRLQLDSYLGDAIMPDPKVIFWTRTTRHKKSTITFDSIYNDDISIESLKCKHEELFKWEIIGNNSLTPKIIFEYVDQSIPESIFRENLIITLTMNKEGDTKEIKVPIFIM